MGPCGRPLLGDVFVWVKKPTRVSLSTPLWLGKNLVYRYFVDAGIFLASEQSASVFSDARRTGFICPHKSSKKGVFPVSTKYRYSGEQKE